MEVKGIALLSLIGLFALFFVSSEAQELETIISGFHEFYGVAGEKMGCPSLAGNNLERCLRAVKFPPKTCGFQEEAFICITSTLETCAKPYPPLDAMTSAQERELKQLKCATRSKKHII